jgi:Bacterial Ig-like domain
LIGPDQGSTEQEKQMALIRSLVALLTVLLAGCGGGGSSASPPVGPPPAAATADLTVTVADTTGAFIDGATVKVASSGASATTNAAGQAVVKVAVGGEEVVVVDKAGFAEQVRVVTLAVNQTRGTLTALLVAREAAQTMDSIENGGSAAGKQGVKVTFPPGALVNASGQAVSGPIQLFMTPLDVSISDVGAFPGVFEGVAAGTPRGPIVSLGTSELVPQQNGEKLQLASGKAATIELPLYATHFFDGSEIKAGDSVPLWSLDTATGVWQQGSQGTVVAQPASPSGFALRATITHFSWWNVDQFAAKATANVKISVVGNAVPAGTFEPLEAQVVAGSGPTSVASTDVVIGTPTPVTVPAPSTMRFSTRFELGTLSCSGSTTAAMSAGATTEVTIQATCVEVPVPTIVTPTSGTGTNSRAPMRVQIVLSGNRVPDMVELFANDTLVKTFAPQFFYVHLLDTAGLPEGDVLLEARATLSGITRVSADVDLIVDRTPPVTRSISPSAATRVGRGTPLRVTFDEAVTASPFAFAQSVVLSVVPTGQTAPIAMPADVRLDSAGTTLTVTPTADFPAGRVGLSWAALTDAAGNNVGGPVNASWDSDRSVFVGPQLGSVFGVASFESMTPAVAIRADGGLLVAHRPAPGTNLTLSRYDAASDTWLPVVAAVNERSAQHMLALAVDGQDVPYLAFTQQSAADPAIFELVLKRLNGASLELAAPAVALAGPRSIDISHGSMAIDGSNRPVITFTDSNGASVRLFRLEQGTLVSLATVTSLAADPQVALEDDGTPLVAYLQGFVGSGAAALRVARVVNGVVTQLGPDIDGTPNSTQAISRPRLVLRGSEPWVFWTKFDGVARSLKAARFDGAVWIAQPAPAVDVDFGLAAGVVAGDPVVAAGGAAGVLILRFHDGAFEPPFDATPRSGRTQEIGVAARGSVAALISVNGGDVAEVQQLLFP